MTEYEKNFSDKGTPICSVWAKFKTEGDGENA